MFSPSRNKTKVKAAKTSAEPGSGCKTMSSMGIAISTPNLIS